MYVNRVTPNSPGKFNYNVLWIKVVDEKSREVIRDIHWYKAIRGSQYVGELSDICIWGSCVSIETYIARPCMHGTISNDFPRRSGTAQTILRRVWITPETFSTLNLVPSEGRRDKNIFPGTRKD